MIFARVVGTVVGTQRSDEVAGARFLVVQPCSHKGEPRGDCLVALDVVGAGPGELVMISQGPSARNSLPSERKPVDALISGIVDLVDERGTVVYRK